MQVGFAGLVAVVQQAFVSIGTYAVVAMIAAGPVAFFAFRPNGACFATGTRGGGLGRPPICRAMEAVVG